MHHKRQFSKVNDKAVNVTFGGYRVLEKGDSRYVPPETVPCKEPR